MSASTALAISVGKSAVTHLLQKYGDDALIELREWVQDRHARKLISESESDAFDEAIKQALEELKRPYEDFFGPWVGKPGTTPDAPVPPTQAFPYYKELQFHPLTMEEKLQPGDRIWKNKETGRFYVKSAADAEKDTPPQSEFGTWEFDKFQP